MGIYPEIIDDFDPGFPRDSYNRGESIIITPYVPDYAEDYPYCDWVAGSMYPFEVIGAKRKKKRKGKKARNKTVKRTFKMPAPNANVPGFAREPTSYDESQGRLTTYGTLEDQYDQDYASNYPDTTMYDGSGDYSEEYGAKKKRRKGPTVRNRNIAARKAQESEKRKQIDRLKSSGEKAQAVSKAVKRVKQQEAVKKEFEEKLSNLEHEIERRDISENVRQQLEAQADEYENMIAELQEQQRVELDEIRASEANYRNPDTDPTFIITEDDDAVSGIAIVPTGDGYFTVGAKIDLDPIYAEVVAELNNQVGLSFKGFFKKIGKIAKRVANSRIVKRLAKLAKTAAAMYTGGASSKFFDATKQVGGSLVKGLKQKDPKSIAIVGKIVNDAKNGDPDAAKALAALNKEAVKSGMKDMLLTGKVEEISGYGDMYAMGAMLGCRNV